MLALALAACGAGEEDGPPPDVVADLTTLQRLIDRDPATEPLELVERRIDEERPVHAAEMLEHTGVPAAERQVAAIRDARVGSDEGRRYQRRLREAYQARVEALDAYRVVLEGGVSVDPVEQLDAMRGVREAEEGLLEIVREMNARAGIRPRSPRAPEGEGPVDENTLPE